MPCCQLVTLKSAWVPEKARLSGPTAGSDPMFEKAADLGPLQEVGLEVEIEEELGILAQGDQSSPVVVAHMVAVPGNLAQGQRDLEEVDPEVQSHGHTVEEDNILRIEVVGRDNPEDGMATAHEVVVVVVRKVLVERHSTPSLVSIFSGST